jgi:aminoglycoside 6'-N-acetyltransferase
MIAELVDGTWARYPDISAMVVAVQQGNPASWRALEGAGFERVWEGMLDSDDPSDEGPSFLYSMDRPAG